MIVSNCPRCSESLRVPEAELPEDAYAKCPWCRETFPVSEITAHLPPLVELIDAEGQPLAVGAAAVAATAGMVESAEANPFAAPEIQREPVVDYEDQPYVDDLNFGDTGASAAAVDIQLAQPDDSAAPAERPPTRVRTKKTSKKKGSPVRTLIGIALGPVLALPLAGAILLALGRAPDLGFWPFDGSYNSGSQSRRTAAPPSSSPSSMRLPTGSSQKPAGGSLLDGDSDVGQAVKEMNADSSAADARPSPQIADLNRMPGTLPAPGSDPATGTAPELIARPDEPIAEMSPRDAALSDILGEQPPAIPIEPAKELTMPDGVAAYPGDAVATSTDNAEQDVDPAESQLQLKPSSLAIADTDSEEPEPESTESNELALPEVTVQMPPELAKPRDSVELLESIEQASASLASLHEKRAASTSTRRDLATAYVDIAAVGTLDAHAGSESVRTLLTEVSGSPALDEFSMAAPQWWSRKGRLHDGLLLVGAPGGDADRPTITLSAKDGQKTVVPVVLPQDVSLPRSSRVIAIGLITSDGGSAVQIAGIQPLP